MPASPWTPFARPGIAARALRRARSAARWRPGPPPALPDGRELFDQPFYTRHTEARLRHLAELGLPVEGCSVIDVGCGIGRLAEFFEQRGCDVLCVDGRAENIDRLRELYPHRRAAVVDVETD